MPEAWEAYEDLAPRYDSLAGTNRILALLRRRSVDLLVQHLPPEGRLIELGCGSGTEAVKIARRLDADILACDPAPSLAQAARHKAQANKVPLTVEEAPAGALLNRLADEGRTFDGGWSSFALGYDRALEEQVDALARVIEPGGVFVCSLRNTWCLAEAWSIPSRALGTYRHDVDGEKVSLWHASPREARDAFEPAFGLVDHLAAPVLVPPPRYGRAWNKLGPLAEALEGLDERLCGAWPFRSLGDHTLFVFERRDA